MHRQLTPASIPSSVTEDTLLCHDSLIESRNFGYEGRQVQSEHTPKPVGRRRGETQMS
jgi:hypothetical protein